METCDDEFRNEKNSNREGAFRIPVLLRWPGKIPAGMVSNEIVQHHDWLPTFLAAAGEPDVVEKCKKGHQAAGKTFRVHIDGYNLLPYLTGQKAASFTIDQALAKMSEVASGAGR
ncbi:sulfatase/phosphatase domain-containing protein [Methylocaldum sp.]|uniref:sulfatase/phosphatase domain-containing protein n=1 Tax=Methylocaldum sp. TaxID=1969727 RepID=UPI00321FA1B4